MTRVWPDVLSSPPILASIVLHCVARRATEVTGIGLLSTFRGEATASSPWSPSSAGSNKTEMRTAQRCLSNAEHTTCWSILVAGAEAVLRIQQETQGSISLSR